MLQRTTSLIRSNEDALLRSVLAILIIEKRLENTESNCRLCSSAGLRYNVYAYISALAYREKLVESGG